MLIKLVRKLIYPHTYSSEVFIRYLKKHGVEIGENTYFFDSKSINIDINRGKYIKIGNNVKITSGVNIIAHDYSWETIRKSYNEIIPSGGKFIEIGNNVFIGQRAIILGDVKIGNNCIIGAGAVVTKDIPENMIVAGNPARIIGSIEAYYEKLKNNLLENALREASNFYKSNNRLPLIEETGHFMTIFLERTQENVDKYIKKLEFKGDNKEEIIKTFLNTKPMFKGYNEYINYLKKQL